MEVLSHFDGGVAPPFEIFGDTLTFALENSGVLHVLVRGAAAEFVVRLRAAERPARTFEYQGLFYSHDGLRYRSTPVVEPAPDASFSYCVPAVDGRAWVSTRIPYGRDNFDRLLADCIGTGGLAVRMLESRGRVVPVFEFGKEAKGKRVHWFVAGEDAWETAGTWVADAMVRALASDRSLAARLLSRAAVCIVPLASPYSATQPGPSYTLLEGDNIYGAATWTSDDAPAEFALIREEVLKAVRGRRLGLLLNIHSWNGAYQTSTMEFIRTAAERELTGERLEWAKATLGTLMTDVPLGKTHVSEKIWHPGLARDYMLSRHDVVTFRIEITTAGQSYEEFTETAHRLLENTAAVKDWSGVLPGETER